ncbi:hypothetical protein H7097_00290 [Aeromicrobium sp.]|nr:hypothetical protein [Candidatus Saccharibacteria bacterium]
MKRLRRPLLFTTTTLFRASLFLGIPLMGFILYFGRADYLESTLRDAHAYDSFVPAITETLSGGNKGGQGIPFTDPGVRQIISNGLPPQVLEDSSNKVIDGMYDWLEGTTPQPTFRIDLTKNRDYISENISLYAFNQLTKQPVCTTNPTQINPFTATCLPSNFSLEAEKVAFAAAIEEVFPTTVFTADNLPKLKGNKTIAQAVPNAPTYYRLLRLSPIALLALVVGLGTAIVRLCRTKRLGYRLLGSTALSTGVALMITPVLYLLAYPRINSTLHLQSADTGISALSTTVISALSGTLYIFLIKAALMVINLGLIIVLLERFTRYKEYAMVAHRAGLVSSSTHAKARGGSTITADLLPIQSSDGAIGRKQGKIMPKFRKITDKELS